MATYHMTVRDPIAPPDGVPWVERVGERHYRGYNGRGASVAMGPLDSDQPDLFTPGELLKLALAGCAGMSSDRSIARQLGDDYPATIAIESVHHQSEDRYEEISELFLLNLDGLAEEELFGLRIAIERALTKHCTVGNTVTNAAAINLLVASA